MSPSKDNTQGQPSQSLDRLTEIYEGIQAVSMETSPPFTAPSAGNDVRNRELWEKPESGTSRQGGFDWSKPDRADPERLAELAAVERARQLEGVLAERDRHIRVLRRHLVEANRHRVQLGDALQRYEGKPTWPELWRENVQLREQLERVSRENVVLAGLQKDRTRLARSQRHQRRHLLAP